MREGSGLRERKKARTRRHIADTAARLFASRGYDDVSTADVAEAAQVSDQTVYNYFPAKQDLVLDRSEELRERYARTVRERPAGSNPAPGPRNGYSQVSCSARMDVRRPRDVGRGSARGHLGVAPGNHLLALATYSSSPRAR
ncbi:TetR/AcrR family transcriptional regulator [Actinacidiphila acididurans]|uniref:Helix-turn-helix transcriptional regulator n=1 Tax=Actinacidiphila acididurans TaxID=2784346 RepID=A0ABS2TSI6_9ACTN|nr:TetR/AcrR family transcriptional regulator [Actinacidiphila acididurans]MBM9506284.1 helix-turn-helix transcriptional regulator [Actinacidiphila acididurans]